MDKVIRKVVADQPRVTHFSIPWDHPEPELEPSSQEIDEDEGMNLSELTGDSEEEEEEEDDDSLPSSSDEEMGPSAGPFNS